MKVDGLAKSPQLLAVSAARRRLLFGHAHKRLKRSADHNVQPYAIASPQSRTSGGASSSNEDKSAAVTVDVGQNERGVVLSGSDSRGRILDGQHAVFEDSKQWHDSAFPSYLQSKKDDFCQIWDERMQDLDRRQSSMPGNHKQTAVTSSNPVWVAIRKEAARDAANEPVLSSFMYASILSHDNFLECLAFVLANRMSNPTVLATEYFDAFMTTFTEHDEIVQAALDDLQADPACGSYSNAILFYKGYQAIQVHRIAHCLWNKGQKISARALQSRVSEVFSMDIHPQAKFGKGILMDHGIGIVIGQTAEIGNNVSILQNVTLGGTGKQDGDRHPKISDNVLIGAAATILGNIRIGKGAMVASGSLVLKPVPSNTMVAGSPAKEIGLITGNPALKMQHWLKDINPNSDPFSESFENLLRTNAGKAKAQKQKTAPTNPLEGENSPVGPSERDNGSAQPSGRSGASESLKASVRPTSTAEEAQKTAQVATQHVQARPTRLTHRQNGSIPAEDQKQERRQERSDSQNRRQGSKSVDSVKSDERAKRLWPNPQEPEYYL